MIIGGHLSIHEKNSCQSVEHGRVSRFQLSRRIIDENKTTTFMAIVRCAWRYLNTVVISKYNLRRTPTKRTKKKDRKEKYAVKNK